MADVIHFLFLFLVPTPSDDRCTRIRQPSAILQAIKKRPALTQVSCFSWKVASPRA
jgi:hypothetical protein